MQQLHFVVGAHLSAVASGHGQMTHPLPRNAIDLYLPIFKNGSWPAATGIWGRSGCNCADAAGGCEAATGRPEGNGQACLWFSQGCTIGCETCTGTNGHTTQSLCNTTMQPTIMNPNLRTMNRNATPGSAEDYYKYNPWRAPGNAPVSDACGMAGGTPRSHEGPGVAVFTTTDFAKQGDLGSAVLAPGPPMAEWIAGTSAEVSWGIRYNHGGGYQYRLCPAGEPLTEACFQRHPLEFVRDKQQLRWNNGTRLSIPGTFVDEGTYPGSSTWSMNPIPRINWGSGGHGGGGNCKASPRDTTCRQFTPPCQEDMWDIDGTMLPWHRIDGDPLSDDVEGYCSGDWTSGTIVDEVVIPKDLEPGMYVLGWRYDCEETSQVWSSCADVRISAAPATTVV